jgi:hypothetical protein
MPAIEIVMPNGTIARGFESPPMPRKTRRIEIRDDAGRVIGHSIEWYEAEAKPEPTPAPAPTPDAAS